MDRRSFLALTAAASAATLLPGAALASVDYRKGLVKKHLAKGETVFLDFKASWCTTCRAQERVINALKSQNADYEANITFIDVDWDEFSDSQLVKDLSIPRRSTLVALKGDTELGRIVAGTSKSQIKALMDAALTAATA